jgi:hypothetical protein
MAIRQYKVLTTIFIFRGAVMFRNWTHTSGFFDTAEPGTAAARESGRKRHARLARAGRAPLWSNDTAVRWERTLPSWVPLFGGAGFDTSDGGKYPDEKYDTVGIPIQFGKTDPGIYTALDAVDIDAEPIQFGGLLDSVGSTTRRRDSIPSLVPTNNRLFYLIDRLVWGTREVSTMTEANWKKLFKIVEKKIGEASDDTLLERNNSGQTAVEYGNAILSTNFNAVEFRTGKNRIVNFIMPLLQHKIESAEREQSARKRERDEEDAADARKRQKEDMELKICSHVMDVSRLFVSSLEVTVTGGPTLCFIADNAVYACSGSSQNVVYVTGTEAVVKKMKDDRDKDHFFVFLGAFGNYTIDSLKEDVNLGPGQFFNPAVIEDLKRDTRRAYTVSNILRLYEWARARVAQREEILHTLERLSRIPGLNRVPVYVGSA